LCKSLRGHTDAGSLGPVLDWRLVIFQADPYSLRMAIGDSFVFARGDCPRCTLQLGSEAGEAERYGAALLAGVVRELCGARLTVVETERVTGPRVLLGTPASHAELHRVLIDDAIFADPLEVEHRGHVRQLVPGDLGDQGFVVYRPQDPRGERDVLVVAAATGQGLGYGVSTVTDRLHVEDDCVIVDGLNTRLLPVVHKPAFAVRSVFTGLGGPDWLGPGRFEQEFGGDPVAFVDWFVRHRFNHLLVHNFANLCWGVNYDSRAFPELVNPHHPNVRREFMGELIRHAHRRHVQVYLGVDLPDNWSGVIRAHPEWAGANVDWSCFPTGESWDDFARGSGEWRYAWFETNADGISQQRGGRARQVRSQASWVCLSHPEVYDFWCAYWEELLDTYPEIDGVGGQFSEHLYRCDCKRCEEAGFFALAERYFAALERIARRHDPGRQLWLWLVPGVRDILRHHPDDPGLTCIDWGLSHQPFQFGRAVPKSDWYLCHGSGQLSPHSVHQFCRAFQRFGLRGLQMRGVGFLEQDRAYQTFADFAWNPDLTLEDFADQHVLRQLRRRDDRVSTAFLHLIRAQGLLETLSYGDVAPTAFADSVPPSAWVETDHCRERLAEERAQLAASLADLRTDHPFLRWLRAAARQLVDVGGTRADHVL